MPQKPRLIDTPLPEIKDQDLLGLIAELREITTVEPEPSYLLFGYLSQCLYPAGFGKRYKIEKGHLSLGGYLVRKVSTFQQSLIYKMCDELAQMQNQSAEVVLNMALYVFLNKYLPDHGKKPKSRGYDPRDWRG